MKSKNVHGSNGLSESKGMGNFASTGNLNNFNSTNSNNLRGSNCFKALIESRNKSPNKF